MRHIRITVSPKSLSVALQNIAQFGDDGIEGNFDKDAEISAFELRSILNKILAKCQDIKCDGFSIETCKIMVDLLDAMGKSIIKQSLLGSLPCCWMFWSGWGQSDVCAGKREKGLSMVRMALAVGLFHLSVIWLELSENDGSGKLRLKEFHPLWTKTQKYQKIYREIDVDRSGSMNSYEMRRALETAGLKLNCQLHQVIMACFPYDDLVIDFDNFLC
ncbi:hypothetical protein DV515_00004095 [Chloebia gouldiae]|uniref:EF-hand domain-containing protein n=1 Tax=Chloebia gouldiae TaxID=44316 RepID=A0A3L8SRU7_CHLGU|nr:hypothetical protein DV515_00004095 [Chloebia gouldiae]